jgi:MFS family permease
MVDLSIPPPLRSGPFRLYLLGGFFGLLGMWTMRVVAAWLAWDLSGSAAWTGTVAFLSFAPTMVSGPFFGVVADRVDPRFGIAATQSIQATVAVALLALVLADALTLGALCAAALAIGVAASAYHPMRMSLAPRLAPRDALPQAIAMTAVNFNLTRMIGPMLGGWLLAHAGGETALTLAAVCYGPQILVMFLLPAQPPEARDATAPTGVIEDLAAGARYAWAEGRMREAMAISGAFALIGRGVLELLPAAADGVFHKGAAGLGMLAAAAGAGAMLSALHLARRGSETPGLMRMSRRAAYCGLALTAALGFAPNWPLALALTAGIGLCGTAVGIGTQSVVQIEAPDGLRGRLTSLWIVVGIGGAALGAVALGAAADLIGLGPALAGGAALSAGLLLLARR